ncbi:hypothetical protein N8590_03885 [bacterium]|jgi:hypothetical protein|nr:hypothetical protein [bacterium]
MMTLVRNWSMRFAAAALVLATIPASADDAEGVVRLGSPQSSGIVRISDNAQPQLTVRGQSPEAQPVTGQVCETCPAGVINNYDPYAEFSTGPYLCSDTACVQWLRYNMFLLGERNRQRCATFRASCRADCVEKKQYIRCKFGYLCPTGADGKGAPPFGRYQMVYPVDPNHFDNRDAQVYAASGYGGPVAVPIAPNVNHTYNYGWGIPSSRLTPIAHPLTPGVPTP